MNKSRCPSSRRIPIPTPFPFDVVSRNRGRVASAVAVLLAACGGGGTDTPPAAAGAPPAAAAPATPAPGTTGPAPLVVNTGTCNLPDFAAALLTRVNQARNAGATCGSRGSFAPAGGLAWNSNLGQAADAHSRDRVGGNFCSHTGTGGSNAGQRITAAGYSWSSYGENIAAGQATVVEVVDGWMASEGHCANIMNGNFVDIGVACVPGTSATTYRSYWTMALGKPR